MRSGLAGCKGIVLDIDGTICSLSRGIGELYSEALRSVGVNNDVSALERAARKVWPEFESEYLNSKEEHRTTDERERSVWLSYAQRVLGEAGISEAEDAAVVQTIYDSFAFGSTRRLEDGVVDFLNRARSDGVRVFAATNNDERSRKVLSDLGVSGLLDEIFTAGQLGWKKPSHRFFEEITARVRLEPGDLAHVGNNLLLDVEAAKRSGWRAILYTAKVVNGVQQVKSFHELSNLLS